MRETIWTMGLDLSTTATGVVSIAGGCWGYEIIKPKASLPLADRIDIVVQRIAEIVGQLEPSMIAIETPIIGRNRQGSLSLAQLAGAVRYRLRYEGYPYIDISPCEAKKYATGKGNASKEQVLEGIKGKWGIEIENDNVGDAFVLAQMGMEELSHPSWRSPL